VIFTILLIPLVLFGVAVDLNLAWTYYFTGVLISSCVFPISCSISWARVSSAGNFLSISAHLKIFKLNSNLGMISGVIGGCLSGIVSWLSYTHVYEGGLDAENFIRNSGKVSSKTLYIFFTLNFGAMKICRITVIPKTYTLKSPFLPNFKFVESSFLPNP